MSPIALGTFEAPPSQGKAGSFKPQNNVNRPIIAVPREFKTNFVTAQYPDPKDVVIYDVFDLMTGNIEISVITGSGAMVDRLKQYVPGGTKNDTAEPKPLPVKIVKVERSGKSDYYSIESLEGKELQLAVLWDQKIGISAIEDKRAEVVAEAGAAPANADPSVPAWMNTNAAASISAPAAAAPAAAAIETPDALDAAIAALGG